jgi:4,5-dihydroxyphthalate decarboxylase
VSGLPLTLALEAYDRTQALVDGRVRPEGIDLRVRVVDSTVRHRAFLQGEYDAAEMSLSTYLMARERGLPLAAVPVFPRRLFSASAIYTRPGFDGGPEALRGGRIGAVTWQFTMSVVARGDLHHHYGVPMDSVTWVTSAPELLPVERFPARVEHRPGADLDALLAAGALDAQIYPDVLPVFERGRAGRLFPDFKAVEQAYFRRTGIFPIMHVLCLTEAVARRHPWAAGALYRAFERAKAVAYEHLRHPFNLSLIWSRALLEEQEAILPDPFPYGLGEANRRALEAMMRYQVEQGLLRRPLPLDDLFLEVDARGEEAGR